MSTQLISNRALRRLNRRQRKKLYVGEFQEFLFVFKVAFCKPMKEDGSLKAFEQAFVDMLASRRLALDGMDGPDSWTRAEGIVWAPGRRSTTEEDRQAVLDWLGQHPDVASAEAEKIIDSWYGWGYQQATPQ